MQFKIGEKFRGFNTLGDRKPTAEKISQKHLSDLELLRFYMRLANEYIIMPNSAGWHRMIMIADKIRRYEGQIQSGYNKKGAYIGYLKKNKTQRNYVRSLIEDIDDAQRIFS